MITKQDIDLIIKKVSCEVKSMDSRYHMFEDDVVSMSMQYLHDTGQVPTGPRIRNMTLTIHNKYYGAPPSVRSKHGYLSPGRHQRTLDWYATLHTPTPEELYLRKERLYEAIDRTTNLRPFATSFMRCIFLGIDLDYPYKIQKSLHKLRVKYDEPLRVRADFEEIGRAIHERRLKYPNETWLKVKHTVPNRHRDVNSLKSCYGRWKKRHCL